MRAITTPLTPNNVVRLGAKGAGESASRRSRMGAEHARMQPPDHGLSGRTVGKQATSAPQLKTACPGDPRSSIRGKIASMAVHEYLRAGSLSQGAQCLGLDADAQVFEG